MNFPDPCFTGINGQEEQYEQFQEWLNQCPIKIIDYIDNTHQFTVEFSLQID